MSDGDSIALVIELVPDDWVSVHEPQPDHIQTLKITPHPFSSHATVDLSDFKSGHSLQLIGLNGQILQTYLVESRRQIIIEKPELPKGNYFLRLCDGDGRTIASGKIIKQ